MHGDSDNRRDLALLAALTAGRSDALAELYDRHSAALFRHAVALTRQRLDAEDLVQAAFVKLATTGAELLGVRNVKQYLHRILHTTWLDDRRRQTTGTRVIEQADADLWMASTETTQPESAIDVSRALGALPPLQREVVVLHLVDGLSFREIGRLTGVSLFTAAGRYRLGIARMRDAMSNKGQRK